MNAVGTGSCRSKQGPHTALVSYSSVTGFCNRLLPPESDLDQRIAESFSHPLILSITVELSTLKYPTVVGWN